MDDNPVRRLLSVLPPDTDMPTAARVRYLLRHIPGPKGVGGMRAAQDLVRAVATLAATAEEARLPLALPARFAAKRLATAGYTQVLAWMRASQLLPEDAGAPE